MNRGLLGTNLFRIRGERPLRCALIASMLAAVTSASCHERSVADWYAEDVLRDGAEVTRTYLVQKARENAADARLVAAATTFSDPELLALGPSTADIRFSYVVDGREVFGAADLKYDHARESWRVGSLWMIHEY